MTNDTPKPASPAKKSGSPRKSSVSQKTAPLPNPEHLDRLVQAARRLVTARANPKLNWGQDKALKEESNAFKALAKLMQAYDQQNAQESTLSPKARRPVLRVNIEVFNISAQGHKIIAVDGHYEHMAQGEVHEVLPKEWASTVATLHHCKLDALTVTAFDVHAHTDARQAAYAKGNVHNMPYDEAHALIKEFAIAPLYLHKSWQRVSQEALVERNSK